MTNLLWPGDHRAGPLMSDETLLDNMIRMESAWLTALAAAGIAPVLDLRALVTARDLAQLSVDAERTGNPVPALVELLRARAGAEAGRWVHRGLTSQDVLDTALMLAVRDAVDTVARQVVRQAGALVVLARQYRHTPMVARTLTQPAVPTTFGAKAAAWLDGVVDAYERLGAVVTPVQIGGAAGTRSAVVELLAGRGSSHTAAQLVDWVAADLGLQSRRPWHTARGPVTAVADALTGCVDAWGRIATDVATLARPEIGELGEADPGGSSTMPQKRNPVLSILIRRAAISVPPLQATLHLAAALTGDERADGAWHAEWDALRTLARRTVVAGGQCAELLEGLGVHAARMAENLARFDVLAEQRAIAEISGKPPSAMYLGDCAETVDQAVRRAGRVVLGEGSAG